MFRMKGRLTAGVLCAMLAAMLVVPVSAHGCHGGRGGGRHGGYARNVQTTVQTAVTVCPYSDCTLAGRHTHSGVTYCGYDHAGGFCDGTCTAILAAQAAKAAPTVTASGCGHHGHHC